MAWVGCRGKMLTHDCLLTTECRRVEEVVGKALNVTLQKADLNLPRTLRIDFDSNVDSFMGSGERGTKHGKRLSLHRSS